MHFVRVESHDGFVVVVLVLTQGGEVEAVGDASRHVWTEITPTHGSVAELKWYLAIDAFDVAAYVEVWMGVEEGALPRVAELSVDDGHAWQQAQVEVLPDAQVAYDGNMEAGVVVGGDTLHRIPQSAVLRELQVELRLCVAYLYAVVQQSSVERTEVRNLTVSRKAETAAEDYDQ